MTHYDDDDYRPNFALGIVLLTAAVLAGLVIALRLIGAF